MNHQPYTTGRVSLPSCTSCRPVPAEVMKRSMMTNGVGLPFSDRVHIRVEMGPLPARVDAPCPPVPRQGMKPPNTAVTLPRWLLWVICAAGDYWRRAHRSIPPPRSGPPRPRWRVVRTRVDGLATLSMRAPMSRSRSGFDSRADFDTWLEMGPMGPSNLATCIVCPPVARSFMGKSNASNQTLRKWLLLAAVAHWRRAHRSIRRRGGPPRGRERGG